MQAKMNRFGGALVDAFHYLALFAIGGAIVWSAVFAFIGMTGFGMSAPFEKIYEAIGITPAKIVAEAQRQLGK